MSLDTETVTNISITFPDTMRDFTYTRAEVGWATFERMRGFFVFMGILTAGFVVYTLSRLAEYPMDVLMGKSLGMAVLSLTLAAGMLPAMAGLLFLLSWRRTVRQRLLALGTSYGFDDQAFYMSSPLIASRTHWSLFRFFYETKRALVFHDGARTWYLPKRMWSATELDRLRALCQDHIPNRRAAAKRRP